MTELSYFTTGDGCRIAYRLEGEHDHPTLVLSNSVATSHAMWDGQIAELSRQFRVLRFDTRGNGASDAPNTPYSIDRLGHDLIELLDALTIDRVHFCGLSLGGFIGQWLGVHAPERIDRLILSNTSPYLGPAPQWDGLIASLHTDSNMAAMADMFIDNWFRRPFQEQQPAAVKPFRDMILATPPHGLAGCFAAVRDADLRRTIRLIEAPTLIIGGIDDTVTLASHSEQIAAAVPNAELVLMPGVHMLNVEQPVAFMDAVSRFLSDDPRS